MSDYISKSALIETLTKWSEYSWKDEIQFNECDMSRKKSECFEEAIEIVKEECGISE